MTMYEGLKIPGRMAGLRRDRRGVIIPWFVAWVKDGHEVRPGVEGAEPDFRVLKAGSIERALRNKTCWVCGGVMGVHRIFAIGPMCVINRVTMEPPSHRECAEFAAIACPFLSKPRMRRNEKDEPEGMHAPGMPITRNPGCVCLYETPDYRQFQAGNGKLIQLGNPMSVDWWAQGRRATRRDVMDSMDSGFPILEEVANREGPEAMAELMALREQALRFIPIV
jgi:hypothetical protein